MVLKRSGETAAAVSAVSNDYGSVSDRKKTSERQELAPVAARPF